MEQIKSETIKIVTPVGTRFRYSWLVTPDEYKGVEKWKTEAIIPVGEASQKIAQQLEDLIEAWKAQLKAAFPNLKKYMFHLLKKNLRISSYLILKYPILFDRVGYK